MNRIIACLYAVVVVSLFAWLGYTGFAPATEATYPHPSGREIRCWKSAEAAGYVQQDGQMLAGGMVLNNGVKKFVLVDSMFDARMVIPLAFVDKHAYAEADRLQGIPVTVVGIEAARSGERPWLVVDSVQALK